LAPDKREAHSAKGRKREKPLNILPCISINLSACRVERYSLIFTLLASVNLFQVYPRKYRVQKHTSDAVKKLSLSTHTHMDAAAAAAAVITRDQSNRRVLFCFFLLFFYFRGLLDPPRWWWPDDNEGQREIFQKLFFLFLSLSLSLVFKNK
jgi:hypothetical protein